MKRLGKCSWIPFVALVLLVLGASGILWITGNMTALNMMAAFLAPLIAGVVGIYGLAHFAPRGLAREDRFHVMFVFLSAGLFMMLVAEIAGIAVESTGDTGLLVFTVGFIQILGMITFFIGIMGYFSAVNNTMGYMKANYLWMIVVLVPIVVVSLITALSFDPLRSVSLPELVTSGIVAIGFGIAASSISLTAWVFRRGRILTSISFVLLSLLLLFFRGLVWTAFAVTPELTSSRFLGVLAYVMLAGAITAVRVNECYTHSSGSSSV